MFKHLWYYIFIFHLFFVTLFISLKLKNVNIFYSNQLHTIKYYEKENQKINHSKQTKFYNYVRVVTGLNDGVLCAPAK